MTDTETKFNQVLESFDNCMLVTVSTDGEIHARPMVIADVESDESIWFVTSAESGKVDELQVDSRVCVTGQSGNKFISLSGTAMIGRDQEKIDAIWNESWRVWFPTGPKSPDIRLIRILATAGEYWDYTRLEAIKYLYRAGKAYISGQKPIIEGDAHAKVELN